MSEPLLSLTCQRCGSGFVLVETYTDLLERRGIKVLVPPQCPTCFMTSGPMPKLRGRIKWFSPKKHYGFIVAEDGQEVFVHERQILEADRITPRKGQPVLFHLNYPPKGPEALNVELLEE